MFKYIFDDWKTNDSLISRLALATYRFGNFTFYRCHLPLIRHLLLVLYRILDLVLVKTIASADLPYRCRIGRSIYIAHGCNGVIIHPNAVIGDNARIYHQVTIGSGDTGNDKAPILRNNVFVGAGAKVIGEVTLESNSKVGANAVLMQSLEAGVTAVGIPARPVIKKNKKYQETSNQ